MSAHPLRFIRQDIQSMHAYAIQPSEGMVKLDAMENPFTLPASLCRPRWGERLGAVAAEPLPRSTHRRPEATALERYVDMPQGYALMLGNGSDELISLLSMACQHARCGRHLGPRAGLCHVCLSTHLQGLTYVPVSLDRQTSSWTKPPCRPPSPSTNPPSCIWPTPTTLHRQFVGRGGDSPPHCPSQRLWRLGGVGRGLPAVFVS
jgi:hypothetical protein